MTIMKNELSLPPVQIRIQIFIVFLCIFLFILSVGLIRLLASLKTMFAPLRELPIMFRRMVSNLKFRTQFDRLRVESKNVGSRLKNLRRGKFDQFGRIQLVDDGEQDWYGLIQSDKDSCDLNKIIEKYMITGDTSLFMQRPQSGYIDVRQMPKTTVELLNVYNDALSVFEKLPLEERAKYNHDFYQYFASLEFAAGEQVAPDVLKEEQKEEVKTDE